jgi:hypothetical protein
VTSDKPFSLNSHVSRIVGCACEPQLPHASHEDEHPELLDTSMSIARSTRQNALLPTMGFEAKLTNLKGTSLSSFQQEYPEVKTSTTVLLQCAYADLRFFIVTTC